MLLFLLLLVLQFLLQSSQDLPAKLARSSTSEGKVSLESFPPMASCIEGRTSVSWRGAIVIEPSAAAVGRLGAMVSSGGGHEEHSIALGLSDIFAARIWERV